MTGLLSPFSVKTEGYGDALLGKIQIYPGWVDPATVFHLVWQRGYGFHGEQWVVVKADLAVSTFKFVKDPEISFVNFGTLREGEIEWEAAMCEGGETGVRYFEIYPKLVNSVYSRSFPYVTTVMVQVEPLGAEGDIKVPFDTEFEVTAGPLKQKYYNRVGFSASSFGEKVQINLQGT
jgi:hypothetical protein